jgi:hypothetical protein
MRSIEKPAVTSALTYVETIRWDDPTRIRAPSGLCEVEVHQPSSV